MGQRCRRSHCSALVFPSWVLAQTLNTVAFFSGCWFCQACGLPCGLRCPVWATLQKTIPRPVRVIRKPLWHWGVGEVWEVLEGDQV